jgi:hypothetical protein
MLYPFPSKKSLLHTLQKLLIKYLAFNQQIKDYASKQQAVLWNSYLEVLDHRTGKVYKIPIKNNSIPAISFQDIKGDSDTKSSSHHTEDGLKVFDNGFLNTAVMKSSITYVYVMEEAIMIFFDNSKRNIGMERKVPFSTEATILTNWSIDILILKLHIF